MNEPLRTPELKFFPRSEGKERDLTIGKAERDARLRPSAHVRRGEMRLERFTAVPDLRHPEKSRFGHVLGVGISTAARFLQSSLDHFAHRWQSIGHALRRQPECADYGDHQKLSS